MEINTTTICNQNSTTAQKSMTVSNNNKANKKLLNIIQYKSPQKRMKIKEKITKNIKKWQKVALFLTFLSIFASFFVIFTNSGKYAFALNDEYYYTKDVEHLFTHCLIAYPEIAFKQNNPMKNYYKADCITSSEFSKILEELYNNNYVLVKLSSCFSVDKNGLATKQAVKIPKNKKALVFSFDDVNYDTKKMGLGMVDKIILDSNGQLASQTLINDNIDIRYDLEFIPILEEFVKSHPDFSINNAKGVLNLTGYDGILGYRTSHTNTTSRNQEILEAQKVVNKLKQNGWEFASHSYGHYHMNKINNAKFEKEIYLWQTEVEPIVGKTKVYVYPYGEWQVFENGEISTKHKMLQDAGFSLFCGVGMKNFYAYLPNKNHKVLFMDRKCVDGNTLNANREELFPFFTPKLVLDPARLSIN